MMNKFLILANILIWGFNGTYVLAGNTSYNQKKNEVVLRDSLALTRRDESSAATVNALSSTKSYIKLTATVTTINGAVAPTSPSARNIIIQNATGAPVTINHESGSATAADRFTLPGASAITIADDSSASFTYDHGAARWALTGGVVTAVGTGPRSFHEVTGGSGHGSTNTKIRYFTVVQENTGDIAYTASGTLGDKWVIGSNGLYQINYCDGYSAGTTNFGISINAGNTGGNDTGNEISSGVQGLSRAYLVAQHELLVTAGSQCISYSKYLIAGDVIRAHDDGVNDYTNQTSVNFMIMKMSN